HSFESVMVYFHVFVAHCGHIIELQAEILLWNTVREVVNEEVNCRLHHDDGDELTGATMAEIIASSALRDEIERRLLPAPETLWHELSGLHPVIRVTVCSLEVQEGQGILFKLISLPFESRICPGGCEREEWIVPSDFLDEPFPLNIPCLFKFAFFLRKFMHGETDHGDPYTDSRHRTDQIEQFHSSRFQGQQLPVLIAMP